MTNVEWQNLNGNGFTQRDSFHDNMKFGGATHYRMHQYNKLSGVIHASDKFGPARDAVGIWGLEVCSDCYNVTSILIGP